MESHSSDREVVDRTVNAYVVEKLSDGAVRLRSGGYVAINQSYFACLQAYAEHQQEHVSDLPEHLHRDRYGSIYDGYIPLRSFNSDGFEPAEILSEVTAQPLEIVLDDLDEIKRE